MYKNNYNQCKKDSESILGGTRYKNTRVRAEDYGELPRNCRRPPPHPPISVIFNHKKNIIKRPKNLNKTQDRTCTKAFNAFMLLNVFLKAST